MKYLRVLAILISFSVLSTACSRSAEQTEKPYNFVYIVIDALRADHLGAYGYKKDTSPFMDKLANKSWFFKNTHSQESYTMASVPSMLASIYPIQHKVLYDNPSIDVLHDKFTTFPEVLKTKGYSTAAFVFNPHLKAKYNFDQGFDLYDDNKEGFVGDTEAEKFETAQRIYDRSFDWLDNSWDKKSPFMLYLHYRDVHSPYVPPAPYDKKFCKGDEKKVQLDECLYDGEIAYTDMKLEKLISDIEKKWPRTVFIITSDHGEAFMEHGQTRHGNSLYEEETWIPLFFYFADKKQGIAIDVPVETTDIAPTVAALAGAERPASYEGLNLQDIVADPDKYMSRTVAAGGAKGRISLTQDGVKYYKHRGLNKKQTLKRTDKFDKKKFKEEVYNLGQDPLEKKNIKKDRKKELETYREKAEVFLKKEGTFSTEKIEVDKETAEQLEALGYF